MTGKRILCIQEHSEICKLIAVILENFEVISVNNLTQAKKLIETGSMFDLILTGYHLPEGTGVEFCRYIRKLNITTPILMVTGGASLTEDEIISAGAQGLILKDSRFVEEVDIKIREFLR